MSKVEAERIEKEEKHAHFLRNLTPKELKRYNTKERKIKNDKLRALTRAGTLFVYAFLAGLH
jgi:hypothetical protein